MRQFFQFPVCFHTPCSNCYPVPPTILVGISSILCTFALVSNGRRDHCWPGLWPIRYVCAFFFFLSWIAGVSRAKESFSEPIPFKACWPQPSFIYSYGLPWPWTGDRWIYLHHTALAVDFIIRTSALWCLVNITPILPKSMGDSWRRERLIPSLTVVTFLRP